MKSIKSKLLLTSLILVSVVIVGICTIGMLFSTRALENNSKRIMEGYAEESTNVVTSRVNEELSTLQIVAAEKEMTDNSIRSQAKLEGLKDVINNRSYIKMGIADLTGNITYSNGTSGSISDRDYFNKAMQGTSNVSDPLMSKTENIMVVIFAVPIVQDNNVIGVLTATKDGNFISDLITDITFGTTGKAFMINNTGVKIAHTNKELVTKMDNDLENVKQNKELTDLADIEQKMADGKSGVGSYKYNGTNKMMSYAPVGKTNWSLAITVDQSEVLSELGTMKVTISIASVLFLVAAFLVIFIMTNRITKRIKTAIHYLLPISEGDFTNTISEEHLKIKDEVGQMIRAVSTVQQSVKHMLQLIVENSNGIDLDAQNLSAASQQLSSSSEVVANSIQEVTNGAVAQAESLNAIVGSINQFSTHIENITSDVHAVDKNAKDVLGLSSESKESMVQLSESVDHTNESFHTFKDGMTQLTNNLSKISEMSELINSISAQTNLLSLNASIEAARAGEAGRGFAVVAEEIGNLAEQSKKSAENISGLISDIHADSEAMMDTTRKIDQVFEVQTNTISATMASFQNIVSSLEDIMPKIDTVNQSTLKINKEKDVIMSKIEDISAVSQETSASSEEIGASTEEMASSSEDVANSAVSLGERTRQMRQEVEKYKLL